MMTHAPRLLWPRFVFLCFALYGGAGAVLPTAQDPIGHVMAAPANPKSPGFVDGIHVQRRGDAPKVRDDMKIMINAMKTQCGSALMKQTCQTLLSDPAASPKAKSRCVETMSPFKLSGNLNSVGESVIDEYFAPGMSRSAKRVKITRLQQTGVCSAEVVQDESHVIVHYRPAGYTRYERKKDKSGQTYWRMTEHTYVPGLAHMLRTTFDMAQLSGKVAVSASLGNKTLVPGRPCETRRISMDSLEFVSCIHATGLDFPSHVTFEGEVIAQGTTQQVEKLVSYAHNVALPTDLFFPKFDEKVRADKAIVNDPGNPTRKWCAAEKARTGIDPCETDDD
jgi:hypothetical protein